MTFFHAYVSLSAAIGALAAMYFHHSVDDAEESFVAGTVAFFAWPLFVALAAAALLLVAGLALVDFLHDVLR